MFKWFSFVAISVLAVLYFVVLLVLRLAEAVAGALYLPGG